MLQQNIEQFYCKVGIVLKHEGEVRLQMANGDQLIGHMPTQILENLQNNLWDFGLPDRLLISGDDISAIVFWDRFHTRKYSDAFPEGVITGKSGTSREARPSIF
jgi:hypothetical protein